MTEQHQDGGHHSNVVFITGNLLQLQCDSDTRYNKANQTKLSPFFPENEHFWRIWCILL